MIKYFLMLVAFMAMCVSDAQASNPAKGSPQVGRKKIPVGKASPRGVSIKNQSFSAVTPRTEAAKGKAQNVASIPGQCTTIAEKLKANFPAKKLVDCESVTGRCAETEALFCKEDRANHYCKADGTVDKARCIEGYLLAVQKPNFAMAKCKLFAGKLNKDLSKCTPELAGRCEEEANMDECLETRLK